MAAHRLSSVSSHDSGFVSQDANVYSKPPSPMPSDITSQVRAQPPASAWQCARTPTHTEILINTGFIPLWCLLPSAGERRRSMLKLQKYTTMLDNCQSPEGIKTITVYSL